jgi:hypothetical protein
MISLTQSSWANLWGRAVLGMACKAWTVELPVPPKGSRMWTLGEARDLPKCVFSSH